jgi:hypothetical protein
VIVVESTVLSDFGVREIAEKELIREGVCESGRKGCVLSDRKQCSFRLLECVEVFEREGCTEVFIYIDR